MPIPILRDEVQRLLRDEKAQLVEVLPQQEYEDEHIAGAMSRRGMKVEPMHLAQLLAKVGDRGG